MQLTWSSLSQTELAGRQNLSKSITSTCSPKESMSKNTMKVFQWRICFFFFQVNALWLKILLTHNVSLENRFILMKICEEEQIFWKAAAGSCLHVSEKYLNSRLFAFRAIWLHVSYKDLETCANPTNHQYHQITNTSRDRNDWFSYQAILAKSGPF